MTRQQRESQARYRAKKRTDAIMWFLCDRLNTIPHSKYFQLYDSGLSTDFFGSREFSFVESGKFMAEFVKGLPIDKYPWHGQHFCENENARLVFKPRGKYVFTFADDGYGFYIRRYNSYTEYLGEEDLSWQ